MKTGLLLPMGENEATGNIRPYAEIRELAMKCRMDRTRRRLDRMIIFFSF